MLRRIVVALIGLLAEVNGSKWLFDGKRLSTLGIRVAKMTKALMSVVGTKMVLAPDCRPN